MLGLKQTESDQTNATVHQDIADSDTGTVLLPESSNEELLRELEGLTGAHKKTRTRNIAFSGVAGALNGVGVICAMIDLLGRARLSPEQPNWTLFWIQLAGIYALLVLTGLWLNRTNRISYKRIAARINQIVPALAQRSEVRTLQLLITLADIRFRGAYLWQDSRLALVQAFEKLCKCITSDQFLAFSRKQMSDIIEMIMFPDDGMRTAFADMAIRCGDHRTLEILKNLQIKCGLGFSVPTSGLNRWLLVTKKLKKQGLPIPKDDSASAVERAIAGLTPQQEEAHRTAQLLRPSAKDQSRPSAELVRAAGSNATSQPDELVRPARAVEPDELPIDR